MPEGADAKRSTWIARAIATAVIGAAVAAIFGAAGVVLGRTERVPLVEQRLAVIEHTLENVNVKLDRLIDRRQ